MTESTNDDAGFSIGEKDVAGLIVGGAAIYHEKWIVRRFDLKNLREDLDNCTPSDSDFRVWSSVFFGVAVASLFSWLGALNSKPEASLWFLETAGWGSLVFLVLGFSLYALDKKFAVKAHNDIEFVKKRVDNLISMFDQVTTSGIDDL